jgi:hypothetical protein
MFCYESIYTHIKSPRQTCRAIQMLQIMCSSLIRINLVIFQHPVALYRSNFGAFVPLQICSLFFLGSSLLDTTCFGRSITNCTPEDGQLGRNIPIKKIRRKNGRHISSKVRLILMAAYFNLQRYLVMLYNTNIWILTKLLPIATVITIGHCIVRFRPEVKHWKFRNLCVNLRNYNNVASFLVMWQVINGSGFDNSIYLDFHLAELQLFVTQSCTT